MNDQDKRKEQLIQELEEMRHRVRGLEAAETERKQAEETLGESEEKFSSFFHSASIGMVMTGFDGRFMRVNEALCDMLGYSKHELLGKTINDITHPEDIPLGKKNIKRVFSGETEFFQMEKRYLSADGTILWGVVSVSSVRDASGKPQHMIAQVQDITERKQAEDALRESEEKHRELIENLPQRIFHKDANLIYVSCNTHYARDLGIAVNEIAGKTDFDFYPKALAEKYRADDRRVMASGRTEEFEESYIRDGQALFVQTAKTPLTDNAGNVTGILGIFWDITGRKRMEETLQKSEARYRSLFENMENGFALHEMVFDGAGRPIDYIFLDVNEAFEEQTGLRREDLVGRRVTEALPGIEDDPADWIGSYGKVVLTGESISFENYAEPLQRWYSVVAYRPREGQFAVVFTDITERKRMEEEIEQQRIKAVQADRLHALGEMAAGVAHELNQPLSAISTLSEGVLLRGEAGIHVQETQIKQHMEDTLRLVDRMSEIINHMRVFARDTSEVGSLPFRISEAIQNTLKFVQAQLKVHGIAVHVDIADDLPECRGWPNEIEQVLLNLISNARDVMDARGEKMKTGELPSDPGWQPVLGIQVRLGPDGGFLRIEVSDTGGGIPEDTLPRIFDPFFTTKEVGQGTGLGLSIAQGIVEKHGGRFEVDNRPGDGVTFSVALPVEVA